jgi:hypothetical protein
MLDVVATVSGPVPLLGGPLSNILSGVSSDRRFDRMRDVVLDLAVAWITSRMLRSSTCGEDFEDLLAETRAKTSGSWRSSRDGGELVPRLRL